MDKRTWIIFGVAVVAILTGLVLYSKQGSVDVSGVDHTKPIISAEEVKQAGSGLPDTIYGTKTAKATVIEYADYSCPGCQALTEKFQAVLPEYKDKITFVYREFPITQIHPNSRLASTYALAAGMQGKYWAMHDILFKNRESWWQVSMTERERVFDNYAKQAGINVEKLKTDMQKPEIAQKINFDQAIAKQNGVTGTPTVFINGKVFNTNRLETTEQVKAAFDDAIKEKK